MEVETLNYFYPPWLDIAIEVHFQYLGFNGKHMFLIKFHLICNVRALDRQ